MSGKLFLAGYFDDVVAELGLDRADNFADFFGKSDLLKLGNHLSLAKPAEVSPVLS
jgi:hypothetical protein